MSAVLDQAHPVVSTRERKTYRDDGFLTMRNVLPSSTVLVRREVA
jgi:hypothetical protein